MNEQKNFFKLLKYSNELKKKQQIFGHKQQIFGQGRS